MAELEAENRRLRDLLGLGRADRAVPVGAWEPTLFPAEVPALASGVTQRSSSRQKVELFRALFRVRDDVYALRWESVRSSKSGWGPAVKGGWANSRRLDRELLPLSGEVIACAVFTPRGCVCVGRIGVQFRCLGMLALKHGLLRILQARVPLLLEVSHPAE